jgi:hypothetical protein
MRKMAWLTVLCLAMAVPCAALREITTVVTPEVTTVKVTGSVTEKPEAKALQPVSGSVVNEAGKPIAGARVYVYGGGKLPIVLITDKSGGFVYRPPYGSNQGWFQLLAFAPGYSYGMAYGESAKPAQPIVLRKEQLLKGVVVDEAGKPLDGVSVSLESAWGYSRDGSGRQYELRHMPIMAKPLTDKKGAFVLSHLPDPAGFDQYSVSLRLTKPGRADIRKNLSQRDMPEQLRIVLPVGGVLQGKLLLPDESGPPAGDWNISLMVSDKWGSDYKGAQVGKDGAFRIEAMPPGKISLSIQQQQRRNQKGKVVSEPEPYALQAQRFEVRPGETKSVELVLRKAAAVKGAIVDSQTGKPIQGAQLRVRHSGLIEDSYGDSFTSDKEGRFTLQVPAGEIDIRVTNISSPDGPYYYFGSEDGPGTTLNLAEGEAKTDIVVKVDTSEAQGGGEPSKPTPPDFELTPGTYTLTWDPELSTGRIYTRDRPKPTAEVKALVKKLPGGLSDKATFSAQRLDGKAADGLICIIEDGNKLFIDANRNWDLSDDAPIEFTPPKQQYSTKRLAWIEVQSHQGPLDGKHTTHPIGLKPTIYLSSSGIQVWFDRKGAWKGELDTNKGKAEFATVDFDCNGNYGDRRAFNADFWPTDLGDMIAIDTAARGKVNATQSGNGSFWFEPASKVASKFYVFKSSDTGDSLTVEPFTGPLGQLNIKIGSVRGLKGGTAGGAYVLTPNGMYEFRSEKPPFTIPAGKCRVYYGDAVLDSQTGSAVKIRYSTKKPITVEPNKATLLEVAGDLSLAIDPTAKSLTWQPGQTTGVTWAMKIGGDISVDAIGEQNDAGAPVIKLFDAKGDVVAKLKAGST